jgi:hypothetical protein
VSIPRTVRRAGAPIIPAVKATNVANVRLEKHGRKVSVIAAMASVGVVSAQVADHDSAGPSMIARHADNDTSPQAAPNIGKRDSWAGSHLSSDLAT